MSLPDHSAPPLGQGVRVRIAPSPSGYLHVGTARTAVYNYLFARHHKGKFILRIEDTDTARSSSEMADVILESMLWLGLSWDEGPIHQSQRFDRYAEWGKKLARTGHSYWCYCSPEELEQRRKEAMEKKIAWKYDRKCLKLSTEEIESNRKANKPAALRLKVPEGKTSFKDLVSGELGRENVDIEDMVCLRSDGRPTYNFAVVVDDYEMKISHVIRGNDHISNTFKQILLYRAFDLPVPQFAHLPLILGMDKKKVSKREGAVAVTDYRDMGYFPETLLNFLALLGWSPGDGREIMPLEELIQAFTLERVNPANAAFDTQKLEWMNGEYIRKISDAELAQRAFPFLEKAGLVSSAGKSGQQDYLVKVVSLLKERCRLLTDFAELGDYFFKEEFDYDPKGVEKQFADPKAAERLQKILDAWKTIDPFSKEKTEDSLRQLSEKEGEKPAAFIHPIRLAITGKTMGPALFDIVETLGKERVLSRLSRAGAFIKSRVGSPAS